LPATITKNKKLREIKRIERKY